MENPPPAKRRYRILVRVLEIKGLIYTSGSTVSRILGSYPKPKTGSEQSEDYSLPVFMHLKCSEIWCSPL